ncbi:hypothetical protein [Streptomyces lydicus]|uniref:hypothetical protein n=1 Tax=Streptomyces lydicus TaxID=47763 RepID=UPI001F5071FF|nr:hypothetical protein [Streptomyces lydicus]
MMDDLFDGFRRRHGREPDAPTRTRLQGRATFDDPSCQARARSLDELLATWRRRAIAVTDRPTVDNLLATAQAAARNRSAVTGLDRPPRRGGPGRGRRAPAPASGAATSWPKPAAT